MSPSSSFIRVSEPALGQGDGVRWLIGWLCLDGVSAVLAEAILAAVPADEHVITPEAGGGTRILAELRVGLLSMEGVLTHGGPQWVKVGVEGPYIGPDPLSTTTAET